MKAPFPSQRMSAILPAMSSSYILPQTGIAGCDWPPAHGFDGNAGSAQATYLTQNQWSLSFLENDIYGAGTASIDGEANDISAGILKWFSFLPFVWFSSC